MVSLKTSIEEIQLFLIIRDERHLLMKMVMMMGLLSLRIHVLEDWKSSLLTGDGSLKKIRTSDESFIIARDKNFIHVSLFMSEQATNTIRAEGIVVERFTLLGLVSSIVVDSLDIEFSSSMSKLALLSIRALASFRIVLAELSLELGLIDCRLLLLVQGAIENSVAVFLVFIRRS